MTTADVTPGGRRLLVLAITLVVAASAVAPAIGVAATAAEDEPNDNHDIPQAMQPGETVTDDVPGHEADWLTFGAGPPQVLTVTATVDSGGENGVELYHRRTGNAFQRASGRTIHLGTTLSYQTDHDVSEGDYSVTEYADGDAGATDTAAAGFAVSTGSDVTGPNVTFNDQDSLNGDTVLVREAATEESDDTLAVWNVTNQGTPDTVLAQTDLNQGINRNLVLDLLSNIDEQQTLVAAVHNGAPSTQNIRAADRAIVTPVEADAVQSDESEVQIFWQGQVVVLQGNFTAGQDYQLREVDGTRDDREVGSLEREIRALQDGRLIIRTDRVAPDVYVVEDDGTSLAPGDSLPTDLENYDGFATEVAVQELSAEIEEDVIRDGETATLELNSNRAGYDAVVSFGTGADRTVVARYNDLGDFEDDLDLPIPDVRKEQDIQFNVTVTDTNARASDTVTVEPLTTVVGMYDDDDNGTIDNQELLAALADYPDQVSQADLLKLLSAYNSGG